MITPLLLDLVMEELSKNFNGLVFVIYNNKLYICTMKLIKIIFLGIRFFKLRKHKEKLESLIIAGELDAEVRNIAIVISAFITIVTEFKNKEIRAEIKKLQSIL